MNTSNIKVISLDLFRTLVDVDRSLPSVWRIFLQDKYTAELGQKYWDRATELILQKLFEAAVDDRQFKNARTLYEETYAVLFREFSLDYDPKAAATVLINGHKVNNIFEDVKPFLQDIEKRYRVCLSTDADFDMISNILKIYKFDKIFVSEGLQAYKQNPRFFKQVIAYYNLKPEQILHIGDSQADIITPKKLGLVTCWLNRQGNNWPHETKPDFEVKSLVDVLEILEQ